MKSHPICSNQCSQTVFKKRSLIIAYVMADRIQDVLTGVEEDARKLGCRNWLAAAQGTGRWRHSLEESKAHPGLYS